jgi:flavodoxin I
MKTLIVYSSQTGNTEKLAKTVKDLLKGEKTFCPVAEAPDPRGFDLIALGFWLQAGKPDPNSATYLAKINRANLFLFATHGAAADSAHAHGAMEHARSLAPSARIVGTFSCQGEVNAAVLEKARAKEPQPPWIGDADTATGHPDRSDLERLTETLQATVPEFLA